MGFCSELNIVRKQDDFIIGALSRRQEERSKPAAIKAAAVTHIAQDEGMYGGHFCDLDNFLSSIMVRHDYRVVSSDMDVPRDRLCPTGVYHRLVNSATPAAFLFLDIAGSHITRPLFPSLPTAVCSLRLTLCSISASDVQFKLLVRAHAREAELTYRRVGPA